MVSASVSARLQYGSRECVSLMELLVGLRLGWRCQRASDVCSPLTPPAARGAGLTHAPGRPWSRLQEVPEFCLYLGVQDSLMIMPAAYFVAGR